MVSNKPRFGGGIRMEFEDKQLISSPQQGEKNIEMDKHIPKESTINFVENEKASNKGLECAAEGENGHRASTSHEQEILWSDIEYPSLSTGGHRNDSSLVCPSVKQPYKRTQVRDLTGCSTALKSLGGRENQAQSLGDAPTERESPNNLDNRVDDKEDGNWKDTESIPAEDIARLRKLQELFQTLGIQRKVRIYSKLMEEDKKKWSPVFREVLGSEFNSQEVKDCETMDVIYCKNLFLKDRKGQFYLLIGEESYNVDLKQLKTQLNAARNLSFATVDDLKNILQVKPGEVTPFTIMQESASKVRIVVHDSLHHVQNSSDTLMAFHPFSPLLQVDVLFSELVLFIERHGKQLEILGEERVNAITTKDMFLKDEFSDSNRVKSNQDELKTAVKRGNKSRTDHFDRKGKLKSYIKKNDTRIGNLKCDKPEELKAAKTIEKDDKNNVQEKSPTGNNEKFHETEAPVLSPKMNLKNLDYMNLDNLCPTKRLPEIDEFYDSLTSQQVIYREFDVSQTSREIGPALGARCFLLKDKRQNYFIVISHEFYELDYGRLKKSLHPKKKLEVCENTELPLILGVDFQHFTPFSIMTPKARLNNVQVFFTQKIIPGNIVLCLQHPFASGRRILIKSSELQQLLKPFSSNTCIGMVEEKAWPGKYNRMFTQFDEDDSKQQLVDTKHPNEVTEQNRPPLQYILNSGETLMGSITDKEISNWNKSSQQINGDIHTNSNDMKSFYSFMRHGTMFSNLLYNACRIFQNLFRDFYNFDSNPEVLQLHHGSPVDDKSLEKNLENLNSPLSNKMSYKNDCNISQPGESKNTNPSDQIKNDHPSNFQNNIMFKEADNYDELENHLDFYNINYFIKKSFADLGNDTTCEESNETINDNNENENPDSDSTSQICHTLHLTNESGSQNYLVAGRYSEQISVRRFRRRFQIEDRLFIVNETDLESQNGSGTRYLILTNPFFPFMNKKKASGELGSPRDVADELGSPRDVADRYDLVLFSSIYMEPDMTCMFPLDEHGKVHLCMTSQELEIYAKHVGMEVWYMP